MRWLPVAKVERKGKWVGGIGRIDCVLVYKVDRLSRSLLDFARLMGEFDKRGVSLVSVTQQFNTTTSMGRLTLNIMLSFAQFEREIVVERTRDKMAAARSIVVPLRQHDPTCLPLAQYVRLRRV
jgi:DNA invertase Pin-like site-specific DNA recombinase